MTTKPLPETIAGLEKLRDSFTAQQLLITSKREWQELEIQRIGLESALSHLRSQEETVRRCAEICKARAKPGLHPWIRGEAHECAAAILAAHGLKEKP